MSDNQFDETTDPRPEHLMDAADEATEAPLDRIEKLTPKELGDMAMKFASDTAYAAAGLANLVADKAREFADKQRATLADTAEEGADPAKAFLDQVTSQVNKFVEELGHTYKDLAERGRDAVAKMQAQAAAKPDPKDAPGMFDIVDDAETAEPASTVAEEAAEEVADVVDEVTDEK